MINSQTIEQKIDRRSELEIDKYITQWTDHKRMGYKIYRNSDGKHMITEPRRQQRESFYGESITDINSAFGGIFSEIFGGGKQ